MAILEETVFKVLSGKHLIHFTFFSSFVIVLLIVVFASCKHKVDDKNLLNSIEKTVVANFEKLKKTDDILNPKSIFSFGNYLILKDFDGQFLYSIYDKKTGQLITSFGMVGRGPNEIYLNSKGFKASQSVFIAYSIYQKTAFFFNLEDIIQGEKLPFTKLSPQFLDSVNFCSKFVSIGDELYLGTGYFRKGRYFTFKPNGFQKENFGSYPTSIYLKNKSNQVLGHAFQSEIVTNSEKKRVATVTDGVIEIIDFSKGKAKLIFNREFYESKFIDFSDGENLRVATDSKQKMRFAGSIASCDKYFLVGYSNKSLIEAMETHGDIYDYLIVFNWDGDIIAKIKLQNNIRCFDMDENGENLYAISTNSTTFLPEIVKARIDFSL